MPSNPAWAACAAVIAMALAALVLLARQQRDYLSRAPRRRARGRPNARPARARIAEEAAWTRPPPRRRRPPPAPTGTFAVGAEGEARVARALAAFGARSLDGKYLETDGGYVQFDHVARVGGTLVVVETKNWAGSLAGAGLSPNWERRRASGETDVFPSPVRQVQAQARRLREFLGPGDHAIAHLVVLAGSAGPPAGAPRCVVALRDLGARLAEIRDREGDPAAARVAFARLSVGIDRTPQEQARMAHAMDHERRSARRAAGQAEARRDRRRP